jgi:hypothetical protein
MEPTELVTASGLRVQVGDIVRLNNAAGSDVEPGAATDECSTGTVIGLDPDKLVLIVRTGIGQIRVNAVDVSHVNWTGSDG